LNKLFRIGIVLFIATMFMVSSPTSAFAEQAIADITCAKDDGTQQTFSTGWDNANQYFIDKGNIAQHFCEGGYSNGYPIYVSDSLPLDSPLRWYNSIVPVLEPVPSPSPEPVVSVEPTLDPEPTPIPEPIQIELPPLEPIVEPIIEPELIIELIPEEIVLPDVELPEVIALDLVPDLVPIIEPLIELTIEELTQEVIDDALADGVLTDIERELVADALIEEFAGEAITFEALEESGLDYEDLPPEQPVVLENGVVLTAEVADAIEIFNDTTELLNTLFTDPGKALKAVSNIGADMTPQSRETSQNIVVSAIIVGQVAQIRRVK
jgi:hypothetical protein